MTVNADNMLDLTIGVILVGLAFTASLFGVTSSQTAWYYRHYPNDRRFLKWMVATVWSLDAISLVLYSVTMWNYLVKKEVMPTSGDFLLWTSSAQIVFNACSILIIQAFYAFRIWTLSHYKVMAAILGSCVTANFFLGLVLFVKSISTETLDDFVGLTPFDITLSTATSVTDILLCGTLVTLLARSRTGSAGANRLINRLLLYTVTTGLLTSICSVMSLITVLILPTTAVFVMFYYIGCRMYTVSLLAMLNARERLRIEAEHFGQVTLPRLLTRSSNGVSRRSVRAVVNTVVPPREIVVAIQRDTIVTLDELSQEDDKDARRRGPYQYECQSPVLPPTIHPPTNSGKSKLGS